MSRRLLSLLLSLVLVVGMMAVPAGAADQYLLTYNPNNNNLNRSFAVYVPEGMHTLPTNVTSNPKFDAPPGKEFVGWATSTSDTSPIITQIQIAGDTTVYAIWANKTYNVTFNLNNGLYNGANTPPTAITVAFGGKYTLPTPDPTRDGYEFAGWYTAATGGTKITSNTTVGDPAPTALHAQWLKKVNITLDYDYDGAPNPQTLTLTEGKQFSLPSRSRPGYTFEGWFSSKNGGGTQLTTSTDIKNINNNATYYAKWTASKCTISFNANGGKFAPVPQDIVVDYGTRFADVTPKPSPNRDGYTQDGWSTSSTGPKLADEAIVTGNQTLYAVWSGTTKNITLKYNFPSAYPSNLPSSDGTLSVTYGKPITGLATPSPLPQYSDTDKTKYGFAGWYTEAKDDEYDPNYPDKKLTLGELIEDGYVYEGEFSELHARWTYEVTLDPKDGTVTPAKATLTTGTAVGGLPKPTKDGYEFEGWFTDSSYTAGNEVTDESIADSANKTFYAKWKAKTYDVTLELCGGDLADDKKTVSVTFGQNYPALPSSSDITRTGYEFKGWFKSQNPAEGENAVDNSTPVKETGPHKLYALWKPMAVTVSINYSFPDGFDHSTYKGPSLTKNQLNLEEEFSEVGLPSNPPSFTHDGVTYTFASWYTTQTDEKEVGKQVNFATPLTADMVKQSSNLLKVDLYARWRFNVSFYELPTATSYTKQDTFVTGSAYGNKLYTPVRNGFSFKGWYTKPVADNATPDTARVLETDIASSDNLKLYAAWSTSKYSVFPNANGGKFSASQTIPWGFNHGDKYGSYVTEPEYIPKAPDGYTFDGWYTEKEGGVKIQATDTVTKGGEIFAHWKANQFKLTLKLNYEGAADIVKSVDYDTELSKVLPSPEPDRAGYAFEGWFKDKACTEKIDSKLKITDDVTIYAKWKEAKKVDLDVNGGKLPDGHPGYVYVYQGGTYEKLPTPTWPGSIFKGWYTTAKTGGKEVKQGDTILTSGSIPEKLYARWESKKITVHLDYNGAPNDPGRTITCSVGDTYKSLPAYLSWAGHEFMGWYTKEVGGEKVEKTTVVSVASDDVEEITLYAHWGYTVVFEPGEGSGDMEPVAAEMDQPFTLPECAFTAPDGMRFGGWAIGTPDGPKQASGSQYTVVRNLALYATWTDKPITVTVTCTSGGSLATLDGKTNKVEAERGTDVTFIARPNAGYELKDLQVDGVSYNYTVEYTFRKIQEDHTIHAVFGRIDAPSYTSCDHGSGCPLSGYRDLNSNAWYHDAVHFCMDNVIMGGSNNSFKPNARATRAEVATSLWSAEGRDPVSVSGPLSQTYPDVAVSQWYYQPIEWATRKNILAGYANGRFGPNDSITREQLVSILWRHAGCPKPRTSILRFNDASKVSGFAWEAMLWATEKGIIQGRPGGYLAPKGTATRADVAQVLKNYLS